MQKNTPWTDSRGLTRNITSKRTRRLKPRVDSSKRKPRVYKPTKFDEPVQERGNSRGVVRDVIRERGIEPLAEFREKSHARLLPTLRRIIRRRRQANGRKISHRLAILQERRLANIDAIRRASERSGIVRAPCKFLPAQSWIGAILCDGVPRRLRLPATAHKTQSDSRHCQSGGRRSEPPARWTSRLVRGRGSRSIRAVGKTA